MYDLQEVRVRLDQMTERILSRLKDRSRFPGNRPVYEADAVPVQGRTGISFLQFSLEGLERYHASLGRFNFPDQYPLVAEIDHSSQVERAVRADETLRVDIPITDELVAFYLETVARLCGPGEDADTYGETVYVDADLLNLLNERINIGRHIAAAKIASNPGLDAIIGDAAALTTALKDESREAALLDTVEAMARRYELDPAIARDVFRWIMTETLTLEVSYLQGLARGGGLSAVMGRR